MRLKIEAKKKMQKRPEKGPGIQPGIGCDGLAEAAGEVRRGKLSGYGDFNARSLTRHHPGRVRRNDRRIGAKPTEN